VTTCAAHGRPALGVPPPPRYDLSRRNCTRLQVWCARCTEHGQRLEVQNMRAAAELRLHLPPPIVARTACSAVAQRWSAHAEAEGPAGF